MTGRRMRAAIVACALVLLAACSHGAKSRSVSASSVPPTPTTPTTAPKPKVFPLTGLPVTDPAMAGRPALSIKVDNAPAARPQAGLNQADMVVEELVEGGLTRFFVTYQSTDAPRIGPIRSARPVDADLLRLVGGGVFAFSGAAEGELAPVKDHGNAFLIVFDNGDPGFMQDKHRSRPNHVFGSTAGFYGVAASRHGPTTPPPAVFTYEAAAPTGSPGTKVDLPFSPETPSSWTWDPPTGSYLRTQNGKPHKFEDGSPASATDVVILSVEIKGTGIIDKAGNEDPFVVVIGGGPCWVLRDGVAQAGTWSRPAVDAPMRITNAGGATIGLRPGRTWVELLPRPGQPAIG